LGVSTPRTTGWGKKIAEETAKEVMAFETRSRRISVCVWRVAINKAFWAQYVADRNHLLVEAKETTRKQRASQGEGSERTVEPVFGYHGSRGKDLSVILSGEKKESSRRRTRSVVELE
jgi:hypothetical protein